MKFTILTCFKCTLSTFRKQIFVYHKYRVWYLVGIWYTFAEGAVMCILP